MRRWPPLKPNPMGFPIGAILAGASTLAGLLGKKQQPAGKITSNPAWIEAGANLVGGLANNLIARGNTKAQNRYNSPKEQIRRLNEAGLPYAAFADNQAGNQSAPTPTHDLGIGAAGRAIGDRYIRQQQAMQVDQIANLIEIGKVDASLAKKLLEYMEQTNETGATNFQTIKDAERDEKTLRNEYQVQQNAIAKAQARNAESLSDTQLETAKANLINILKTGDRMDAELEGILSDNVVKAINANWAERMTKAQWKKILQDTETGASQEALNYAAKRLSDQNREIGAANFPVENLQKWANLNATEIGNAYGLKENQVQALESDLLLKAGDVFQNGMTLEGLSAIVNYGSYQAMKAAAADGKLSATQIGKGLGRMALTRGRK